jgi:hypothetical protein
MANEQFEHGRIPLKPLAYKDKDFSQINEIMIDHEKGNKEPNYHIYITKEDPSDPTKIVHIDITEKILAEVIGGPAINANNFTINIEGDTTPNTLESLLNYIYKHFIHAQDPSGFEYNRDEDLLENAINVLLQTKDNTIYLPITSANNVYGEDGVSIQQRLDNMNVIGFSVTHVHATEDEQTSFDFQYPFKNYPDLLEVRIGTTYIAKDRYTIKNILDENGEYEYGTLILKESLENGRRIDLVWTFNSAYDDTKVKPISGTRLANSSISINKLEKTTNSFTNSDSSALVTAKAVSDLHNHLIEAINEDRQNLFYYVDQNSKVKTAININTNKIHKNGDIIVVASACDKNSNATLEIIGLNGNKQIYNIYTADKLLYNKSIKKNQIVRFILNENTATILSNTNNIRSNKIAYDCIDQETEISYDRLEYTVGDLIHVYRNGIRLFQDIDYVDNGNKTITLYVRTESGERIVFESLGI